MFLRTHFRPTHPHCPDHIGQRPLQGELTLEMLGNFVSGLDTSDTSCIYPEAGSAEELWTLGECVDYLSELPLKRSPGVAMAYGAAPFFVMAKMAMVASGGKSWNELFLEKIKEPLGLTASELQFGQWVMKTEQYRDQYRFPLRLNGNLSGFKLGDTDAPNPASGLLATPSEMTRILNLITRGGSFNGRQIIREDLLPKLWTNNFPQARVSPTDLYAFAGLYNYRAGLGTLLYCDRTDREWTRRPQCNYYGQFSANGFVPWMYRATCRGCNGSYNAVLVAKAQGMTDGTELALSTETLREAIDEDIGYIVKDIS